LAWLWVLKLLFVKLLHRLREEVVEAAAAAIAADMLIFWFYLLCGEVFFEGARGYWKRRRSERD
jgi:hypothetical protein